MAPTKGGIDFTHLMTSGQFSDLKLVCQGREFKIHKLVACSQSSVIATALKGEFKEAQSGVISIELFDAETVRRMVEYLYTGNYDQIKEKNNAAATVAVATPGTTPSTVQSQSSSAPTRTAPTPALVVSKSTLHHVQVNAIADYYGIQSLALLANQKIEQAYHANWDSKSFVASAEAAISVSGDKSLHSMMALLTAKKLKELLKSGQLTSLVGDFAATVMNYHVHLLEASQREQIQIAAQREQTQLAAQQQQVAAQQLQMAAQQQQATQQQLSQVTVQQQNTLQTRCQAAEARATRVIENVGKLANLMHSQSYCRNGACQEDFGSYIEAAGDPAEPTYILRCSWCLCRHYT